MIVSCQAQCREKIVENLTGMVIFARVVAAKSFSGAAVQLGLSKSAVSKQIGQLEDRLGARLLNRTTRRLALTETGRVFYEHCVRVLAEVEEAEQAVFSLNDRPRGLLRVSLPMSFGLLHVAPAIPDFLRQAPDLRVELTFNDRVVDLIEEGHDLAVRIAALPDSSLVARRLAPNRMVVCGAPDYLARHGVPVMPADLKQHNCLLYTYAPVPEEWRFPGPTGDIVVPVGGTLRTNNADALRLAALAGVGLILIPSFMVGEDLQAGRLQALLCDHVVQASSVYAVYPTKRHLTPKVRAFLDFLTERFGPEPYWDTGFPAPPVSAAAAS